MQQQCMWNPQLESVLGLQDGADCCSSRSMQHTTTGGAGTSSNM
jgi:hypothetical protein